VKNKLITSVLLLVLCLGIAGCKPDSGAAGETPPAASQSQEEQAAEHRIVSTTVAITEIMDKLELDLVGVPTTSKTISDRYQDAAQIGDVHNLDLETIVSLKPTEILAVSTVEYEMKPVFESAGIQANFLNLNNLELMLQTIETLGDTYDRREQAESVVAQIRQKVEEMQTAVAGKEQPKVLILLGIPGSYLVATEHSYIGDLVKTLGGVNVAEGATVEYVAFNTEALQQANPDVILRAAHGMPEEVVKMFNEEFKTNDIWKHFNAVKNDRVYDLEEAIFGTTGSLAAVQALEELYDMMYPQQ